MAKCTSRWGYARCTQAVHHDGACEGSGYRWRRGRGHMRPILLRDPHTPPALGENGPPVFGVDRLPEKERWDTRDPRSLADARYTRWINGARDQVQSKPCPGCGEPLGFGAIGGSLGPTRRDDLADWPVAIPEHPGRWSYRGRAHRACAEAAIRAIKAVAWVA